MVLGLGVLSRVGGAISLYAGYHAKCHGGDGCFGDTCREQLFGYAALIGGFHALIPGTVLLGVGARPVEVHAGVPGVLYVPEAAGAAALPASAGRLRAELRF